MNCWRWPAKTTGRLLLALVVVFFVVVDVFFLSAADAATPPPRKSSRRLYWEKEQDENSNKTTPIKRRQATRSTVAPPRSFSIANASISLAGARAAPYPLPPQEWFRISTRPPLSREIERLQSSTLWGSHFAGIDGSILGRSSGIAVKSAAEASFSNPTTNLCSSPYRYGPRCEGICHCSTVAACDKTTGACRSGICAHGFMDPPMCQRPCPSGQFGFRCGFYCHCWKGAACDSVNGFCAPEGKCAEEWFGPSCQIRKLELSDAPLVTVSDCENITVSWRQWNSELDFGNPEIVVKNYELELRTPSRPQWRTIYRVLNDDETIRAGVKKPLVFYYTPSPDTRFYQFRVVVNGLDTNGKYVTGVPSIPTEVFQRICPTEDIGRFTIETDPTLPPTRFTLPTIVTPYPYPPQSVETVPNPNPTTAGSATTVPTTSTSPATTTPPIVISNFQVVNDPHNASTVLVSWFTAQKLPSDAGLLVEMLGVGDCDPFQTTDGPQIFRLTNTSVQTLRLERWRQYRITLLRSIAASDVDAASLAKKSIITTGSVPNAAPENLQLEDVASRMARLSWAPLACEDRGDSNVTFEVRLYRMPRSSSRPLAGDSVSPSVTPPAQIPPFLTMVTNRTWVTFNQLSPAFEYSVEVEPRNRYGNGPVGRIQFTTPSEEQPRPAPQFLPVTGLRPDRMTLAWLIPPATPGLVYPSVEWCELKVTPADSVVPVLIERYPNCTQTNRTVLDLKPNTRYLIELSQTTHEGQSHQTMVVATPESPPGPPVGMTHRIYNKTCSEVDWDPPNPANGVITNYSLYLSVIDSYLPLRRSSVERYSQKEPGRLLCSLMLSTHYSFSVQAANSAGLGPMGEVTFWSSIQEPDPPPVPFARLSDDEIDPSAETTRLVVLAQPLRFSTGVITAYYLKLATIQQLKEYETVYGYSTNGSSLYIPPDTKAEAALAALPGRLVHRVLPDRFEQQSNGPLLHQAILDVPVGQIYRVVWAVSVELEDHSRLAASVSDVVRVPGVMKTQQPQSPAQPTTTLTTGKASSDTSIYNRTISAESSKTDDRVSWILGIVIGLIILLVIIAIIILIVCCCYKYSDAPPTTPPQEPIKKWISSEHVQTEDFPLQLEDWFNPTTQIDDSRYVVRGQRVLTPTRYSTTINTPR